MKTAFLLLAQYEKPLIPLKEISEVYFGCAPGTAQKKASSGSLPLPIVRLSKSQKSPLFVHINDLAEFIDQQTEKAREEWESVNL